MDAAEGGVSRANAQPGESRSLSSKRSLKRGQTEVRVLELVTQPGFTMGKMPVVLRLVQAGDELAGKRQLEGDVAHPPRTPAAKHARSNFEAIIDSAERIDRIMLTSLPSKMDL